MDVLETDFEKIVCGVETGDIGISIIVNYSYKHGLSPQQTAERIKTLRLTGSQILNSMTDLILSVPKTGTLIHENEKTFFYVSDWATFFSCVLSSTEKKKNG